MHTSSLLRLLHLCDAALPIGGFSHSAGLETYVQAGIINDKVKAEEFIKQQLTQNIFYTDAALMSLVYDAAVNNNFNEILLLDELCTAVKLPAESRTASNKLGIRLLKIFQDNKSFSFLDQYRAGIAANEITGHYCISFGLLAAALDISKQEALTGFFYNLTCSFITNAVKLIPLGQKDGQQILMSLFPLIDELVIKSLAPDKDLIGFACAGFDIRCMQHEQLYSRLYMS